MELDEVFSRLREEKVLSEELRREILRIFGDRGRKALNAIDEQRVRRYRDFFVVAGSSDEYVVDEEFCTCRDSIYRKGRCWHEIAVRIAAATGLYGVVDLWYQEVWSEERTPDKQYLS